MLEAQELLTNLKQFHCTEQYHPVYPNILLTDGVKYLFENAECFWLGDIIFSVQHFLKTKFKEQASFQLIQLKLEKDGGATFWIEDGNDEVLYTQSIEYTTFPLESIKLYYNTADGVLLLPSEY